MATKIVSEDTTLPQNKNTEHSQVPSLGVYIPSYTGLNQLLYSPTGTGAISYMDTLSQMSSKAMQAQQDIYNKQETTQYFSDNEVEHQKRMRDYEMNNPSGKGLMEESIKSYQELTSASIANASNAEVKNSLQMLAAQRLRDISSHYFQKEHEISVSYGITKNEEAQNKILNNMYNNPEQMSSYSEQFNFCVSSMKNIMDPSKYNAYALEKQQGFAYTYGLALMKKDPYNAKEMIKGQYFSQNLAPEQKVSLENKVRSEIDYRESKAKQEKHEQEMAINKMQDNNNSRIELLIETNQISLNQISDMYEKGEISEKQQNECLKKYHIHQRTIEHKIKTEEALAESKSKNTPLPTVSSEDKAKDFTQTINLMGAQDGEPKTLSDITKYAQDHAMTYDAPISSLQHSIETTIKNSKDPKQVTDAVLSVYGKENVPALSGLGEDIVSFSYLATNLAMGDQSYPDENKILMMRDKWFPSETNKAQYEFNRNIWEKEKGEKFGINLIKEKLGNAIKVPMLGNLVGGTNPMEFEEMAADAQRVGKLIFLKTGSETAAQAGAMEYINARYQKTDINGLQNDYMYLPPEQISKYTKEQCKTIIAFIGQSVIERIAPLIKDEKNNTYKGIVDIRQVTGRPLLTKTTEDLNKLPLSKLIEHNYAAQYDDDKKISSSLKDNNSIVEVKLNNEWVKRHLCVYRINKNAFGLFVWSSEDHKDQGRYKIPIIDPSTGLAVMVPL